MCEGSEVFTSLPTLVNYVFFYCNLLVVWSGISLWVWLLLILPRVVITVIFAKFSTYIISSTFINWNCTIRENVSSIYLFNYLCISIWTNRYLLCSMGQNPLLSLFSLLLICCYPRFSLWKLLVPFCDSCAFPQVSIFSAHFLLSGPRRFPGNCVPPRHHPVLSLAYSWHQPRNPASFCWRIMFTNQDVGTRYSSLLLAAPWLWMQSTYDHHIGIASPDLILEIHTPIPSFQPVSAQMSEAP